ncbi:MAG: CDP-alcohol phosphatidyltransferase family protein, partial [Frankiaceae bacterium]|nr:CDP-alcohol phosphatidyltransferase family protein [Frankiaceae bacterium]
LLGVPLCLWLILGPHADLWALLVLLASGASDWLDGVLARKLNQASALGALLDPAADRLYILAALIGLVARGILPWPIAALLVAREAALAPTILLLRRAGYGPLPVHYLGKAATLNLLYAFPLLLLADRPDRFGALAAPFAWAFTLWGTALYIWAGALYWIQTIRLIHADQAPPVEQLAGRRP